MNISQKQITTAIVHLKKSGIIAYPTEAVYGLGCDPFDEKAVLRLLALKQRSINKGLILVASTWQQVKHLVSNAIPAEKMKRAWDSWPGPVTWVFPKSEQTPKWICGEHNSVAIRISENETIKKLCEEFGQAIVSSSANSESSVPARSACEVKKIFGDNLDYIVEGETEGFSKPTEIYDVLTGKCVR